MKRARKEHNITVEQLLSQDEIKDIINELSEKLPDMKKLVVIYETSDKFKWVTAGVTYAETIGIVEIVKKDCLEQL